MTISDRHPDIALERVLVAKLARSKTRLHYSMLADSAVKARSSAATRYSGIEKPQRASRQVEAVSLALAQFDYKVQMGELVTADIGYEAMIGELRAWGQERAEQITAASTKPVAIQPREVPEPAPRSIAGWASRPDA